MMALENQGIEKVHIDMIEYMPILRNDHSVPKKKRELRKRHSGRVPGRETVFSLIFPGHLQNVFRVLHREKRIRQDN